MSSPYSALASKVRAKFPGDYDDLSDDDLGKSVITKHPEYQDLVQSTDPLTQQTQSAAPATTTRPFFQQPPIGTPFPQTNPIEKEATRQDSIKARGAQAQNASITPFTDTSSVIMPVLG